MFFSYSGRTLALLYYLLSCKSCRLAGESRLLFMDLSLKLMLNCDTKCALFAGTVCHTSRLWGLSLIHNLFTLATEMIHLLISNLFGCLICVNFFQGGHTEAGGGLHKVRPVCVLRLKLDEGFSKRSRSPTEVTETASSWFYESLTLSAAHTHMFYLLLSPFSP